MSENTLRQAENRIIIEGILLEKRLEEKEINNQEAITGEIDIEVAANEVHTLRLFAYKNKQDGTENKIYKGLKTVMDEYKSVASAGKEEADKVRITAGQLGLNEYYGQDGELRSFPQLSTNFINRLKSGEEFNPRAEFEVEVYVKNVVDEIKNDEETGRAILNGYIPLHGGKIIPFSFVVADKNAVDYVKDNYEPGKTVKIYGDIINFQEKKVVYEEVAFGKPKEKITYNTIREYVITGGSEPYDEESPKAYKEETIRKALAEREVYLEELKNKRNEEKPKTETKGFDVKGKAKENKKNPLDDLPF
jgi:hypothetical protein